MNQLNIFYDHVLEAIGQNPQLSADVVLDLVHSYGYSGLECDYDILAGHPELKEAFDRHNLSVASIYCRFNFPDHTLISCLPRIRSLLKTARFFNAENILIIPGFTKSPIKTDNNSPDSFTEFQCKETKKMIVALKHITKAASAMNINITLEDYDDEAAPYSTDKGLLFFLKNVPGLKVTFDTGNFTYSLTDETVAFEKLKSHITHVHLKDRSVDSSRKNKQNNNGKPDLSGKIMYPCEVGSGYIKISETIKRLSAMGYDGSFSIEHFGAVNQLEYMKQSASAVLKLLNGNKNECEDIK